MDLRDIVLRLRPLLEGEKWWRAESPEEVVVGALLTQQTTWSSVQVALGNLKDLGLLNMERLADAPIETLEECIRPTGFYRVKSRRLREVAGLIVDDHGGLEGLLAMEDEVLRRTLLQMPGIGPETADSILLYAAQRPFMVVDAYTRRIMRRLGLDMPKGYEGARRWLEEALVRGVEEYQECHALMVELAKRYCRAQPLCAPCPLLEVCPHGAEVVAAGIPQ